MVELYRIHSGFICKILAFALLAVGITASSSVLPQTSIEESLAILEAQVELEPREVFVVKPSIEQVSSMLEHGGELLAFNFIKQALASDSEIKNRLDWEKLFFEVAVQLNDWSAIVKRSDELSESDFPAFVKTYKIKALIELKQFGLARQQLRNLVWNEPYLLENFIQWRKLIIDSYVGDGMLDDARKAMASFSAEYRPNDPEFSTQYARMLILNGLYSDAKILLEPLQTSDSKVLLLLIQFEQNQLSPSETISVALNDIEQPPRKLDHLIELWSIIEMAARRQNDFDMQITAIETGMSIPHVENLEPLNKLMIPFDDVSYLVDQYHEYAISIGNSFNLVVGDDQSWYQLAQEFDITSPVTARVLFSFLALNAKDDRVRQFSASSLASSLLKADLYRVYEQLFLDSKIYEISFVPENIKSISVSRALENRDYDQALWILNSMEMPQDEQVALLWYLRRVRIAILLGQYQFGVTLLKNLVESLPPKQDAETLDRIVQVVFDLQEHEIFEESIQILKAMIPLIDDVQLKREYLRWLADSYSGLNENLEAAQLLIRSAMLGDNWKDEWGQSARLKAADELTKAEFYEDARRLYENLMEETLDPRSQEILTNRLRQIPVTY